MQARRVAVPAACAALALLALAGRALPPNAAAGPAAFALLVAPGLAAWRALTPRRPLDLAVDLPAVVALGAGVHGAALGLTFLLHRSLVLDLWLIVGATAVLALAAARAPLPAVPRDEWRAAALVVGCAIPIGLACSRLLRITVDLPFHAGRVRKLQDFGHLSVNALDELVHGGPHPGYAFPLWHELVAAAGNVAGVQADEALRGGVLGLVPVAALAAAALARAALRAGPWPGAAAGLVALAGLGIGRHGGGYVAISTPAEAAADLLVPVLLALLVAFGARRAWPEALALCAAAAAISAVHPTYLLLALAMAAAAVAADAAARRRLPPWRPLAAALGLVAAPFALYAAWVAPIARQVAHSERRRFDQLVPYYHDFLGTVGPFIYVRPGHLTPPSTVGLAALLAVPAALLAGRRAAVVLGALAAMLAGGLLPPLPDVLGRALGLSQSHRLGLLLPAAVLCVAGASGVAARVGEDRRRRALAVAGALALGLAAIPLDAHARAAAGLLAALACAAALLVVLVRPRAGVAPAGLAAILAVAVALPAAAYRAPGLARLARPSPPLELPRDLIAALRRLPRRSVIVSDRFTAYTVTAYADVLVYTVPVRNLADTKANDSRGRLRVNGVLMSPRTPEAERRRLLAANDIGYVLVARADRTGAGRYFPTAPGYRTVYADAGYVLLRTPG